MFEVLGGRKFVAATMTVVVGVIVAFIKGDVPPNLVQLLEVTLGVFASGNVVSTIAGAFYTPTQRAGPEDGPIKATSDAAEMGLPEIQNSSVSPDSSNGESNRAPTASPVTNEQIYSGLAEVYKKVEEVEKAGTAIAAGLAEISKSQAVAGKVLNMLLEKQ